MDENPQPMWHLDTGVTEHMIVNRGNQNSLTEYSGSYGVMVGNENILPITHNGENVIGSSQNPISL